jgi:hypothetical protein
MRPLVVVVAGEPVELGLQVGDRDGAGLADQPAFQGLVEALHLAAGLGVVGAGVTGSDPQGVQFQLDRAAPPPRGAAVKIAPLSVSSEAGNP